MAYGQPARYWEEDDPAALSTRYGPKPSFHVKPADSPMPYDEGWGAPPQLAMSQPAMPSLGRTRIDAEDPLLNDWNSAAARRDAHLTAKPKLGDKQYERPAWQKALLAGANAYAGYVNAGRRTHIDPVSDKTLLSRPKYDQAMDAWENQGKAIDSELGTIQSKYAMRRQSGVDDRQNRLADSQISMNEAHARDYDENKMRPPNPFVNTAGGLFRTDTGSIVPGTAPPQRAPANPPQLRPESVLLDPKASPEQKRTAQGIIDAKNRRNTGRGSGAADARADKVDARVREQANRKELADLETEEYGDGKTPGLHERRTDLGRAMSAHDANKPTDPNDKKLEKWSGQDPSSVAELDRVNNRLRMIYKRKLEMEAITRAEYDAMVQGLQGAGPGGPPKPAGGSPPPSPSPAPPGGPKMRKPIMTYDSR